MILTLIIVYYMYMVVKFGQKDPSPSFPSFPLPDMLWDPTKCHFMVRVITGRMAFIIVS